MSDNIIVDTATRIFGDLCEPQTVNAAEEGRWPEELWNALEESGLTLTWVPDTLGGAGAEMIDGFAVLRVAGRFAAPVPLAETLMAGWLLSQAGISAPAGPMTVAPVHEDGNITIDASDKLRGRARHIPFARTARHIAALAKRDGAPVVALVAVEGLGIREGISLAGEPQDTVTFDGATAIGTGAAPAGLDPVALARLGAAMRTQQMAGALEHILDQSVQWSLDRVQFGRPIAKFQAIQQQLALLAEEAAAATVAVESAASAVAASRPSAALAVAAAKIRAGEAAGKVSEIAHQVHGAIGFTHEHSLHFSTKRLWSWRDEFGNEAEWSRRLGSEVAAAGADTLWTTITAA